MHPESPMVSAAKCGWHVREARFSDGSRLFFRFASVSSQNRLSSSRDPPSPAPRVGQERAPAPTRGALFVSRTASSRWLAGLMRPGPFHLGLLPSSLRFASNAATAFDNPLEFPPSVRAAPARHAWQRGSDVGRLTYSPDRKSCAWLTPYPISREKPELGVSL